ncbi:MAG: 30S ribosome-binding factor RbfA [Thalassobaculaceae bacterium]|tara:strand:- start:133 stop:567 length:435 start_codon:yes stop_codon:yes gene_type:complete
MPRSRFKTSSRENTSKSQRQYKVGELIRKTLVEVFEKVEVRDPDLTNVSITISEVSISPDLKAATVYVMPLGGDGQDNVLSGLRRASSFLRSKIAKIIQLRSVPRLDFKIDTAFDNSNNLNKVFKMADISYDRDDGPTGSNNAS